MTIAQLTCTWSGWPGAPGYTNFYFSDPNPTVQYVQTFWAGLAQYFPPPVIITTPNNGRLIDEATGKMTNVWSNGVQASVQGTGAATYTPNAGALIKWYTGGFANGRKVSGKTFLVPMMTTAYTSSGLIGQTICNNVQTIANTMRSSYGNALVIWHRPIYKKAEVEGDPPVLVRPGSVYPVTSTACPTKVSTLSRRRDA